MQRLIDGAISWRDRALQILLARSRQRIGDWSDEHRQHGVLGMTLADLDRRTSTIVVRLKGARDEHRVPVTEDFWAAFEPYLAGERGDPPTPAAWVGLRRGRGKPLSYAAFEASVRHLAGKLGVTVTAHMSVTRWPPSSSAPRESRSPSRSSVTDMSARPSTPTPTSTARRWSPRSPRSRTRPAPRAAASAPGGQRSTRSTTTPRTVAELDAIASPRLVDRPD